MHENVIYRRCRRWQEKDGPCPQAHSTKRVNQRTNKQANDPVREGGRDRQAVLCNVDSYDANAKIVLSRKSKYKVMKRLIESLPEIRLILLKHVSETCLRIVAHTAPMKMPAVTWTNTITARHTTPHDTKRCVQGGWLLYRDVARRYQNCLNSLRIVPLLKLYLGHFAFDIWQSRTLRCITSGEEEADHADANALTSVC